MGNKGRVLQCPMPNAQCPMPNAQCPMPNAQCPMPNAQCPMPLLQNSNHVQEAVTSNQLDD
ncbi:hypothetical protein [Nostoc sp.]|uniref:hypothetical protein n=1 Tax=Nostoc sp. TaxID=1180 RepID=UPI002FFC6B4B